MAQSDLPRAHGMVEQTNYGDVRGDSLRVNGAWYTIRDDGVSYRPPVGEQVQIVFNLWEREGAPTRRYVKSIGPITSSAGGSPPTGARSSVGSAVLPTATRTAIRTTIRIEALKCAVQYLASKAPETDEDAVRCAEVFEKWIWEDRPHFVSDDPEPQMATPETYDGVEMDDDLPPD